jgi:hypothetical protein
MGMKVGAIGIAGLTATALLAIGVSVDACSSKAPSTSSSSSTSKNSPASSAAPAANTYSNLLVNPNYVWDTTAYSAAPPIQNPNGQTGIQDVYTHRDSTRKITDTILVLSDPPGATASLQQSQAGLGSRVVNAKTDPAPVGTGGTIVAGSSPDGSKAVSVLLFTEGKAASTVEFDGSPKDPAPTDAIVEYGQQLDNAIKKGLPA